MLITDLKMPGMEDGLIREVAQRQVLVTDDRDHRLRLDRPGGRGDAARSLGLPDQADRPQQPEARDGSSGLKQERCRTRCSGCVNSSRKRLQL